MISFPLLFVCLFLIVTIFMSFKNVPYGALILWSNFQLQKIDLFYFCYQGLLTVPGVFCRTPNQALGFQIPWITYFRFRTQKSWETISNSFLVLCKMGTYSLWVLLMHRNMLLNILIEHHCVLLFVSIKMSEGQF